MLKTPHLISGMGPGLNYMDLSFQGIRMSQIATVPTADGSGPRTLKILNALRDIERNAKLKKYDVKNSMQIVADTFSYR